jgi:hypothetical protein
MPEPVIAVEEPLAVAHGEPAGSKRPATAAARPTTLVVDLCGDQGIAFATRAIVPAGSMLLVSGRELLRFATDWMAGRALVPGPIRPAATASGGGPSGSGLHRPGRDDIISRLVLFLPLRPTKSFTEVIDRCVSIAAQRKACQVCLVSSFRVHFGDATLISWEDLVSRRFEDAATNTVVVRAGNVVDRDGRCPLPWSRFAAWYPLAPATLTSVFLSRDELFSAIDRVGEAKCGKRRRQMTVLGCHRAVRNVLAGSVAPGALSRSITALACFLSWLQLGRLAGLMFSAAARFYRPFQRWQMATLWPLTVSELLSLYHPFNQRHVALAGYNTGVTHFGWKYPGRTVVTTIASGRLVRIGEKTVTVDAGVLLKRVLMELGARGKELSVVPNYSYISMGTAFMVPIHGSGSEVSTLGDTIDQALIYDPAIDRIVRIRRGDERFSRFMYNPGSGILVLRLRLRIRDKSRYFVKRSRLESPGAAEIWRTFSDRNASNVELRKSRAAATSVEVSRYFTAASHGTETREIPRDSIGRLWDKLEANPISSWLFHAFVRKFGFHVELFLDQREFGEFWRWHATLPVSKLQLRLVKRDGLPHSPFGDADRISVDIFMRRRNSAHFLSFVKEHIPHARFNPGKHSL